ncbi:MAG: excinuclease ABC subunit UvrB [Clostridia bacterium]|nr:excinuclease ABC subunit UvrB [Clostridia bacterium]MBQ8505124.1 excinuclease ABC subunit UvrB [Clostridia bacterium]MBQ8771708.1 excinuclease ABC subunit UvrB [Clostridia bacterium]
MDFKLHSKFQPCGDQPQAIQQLTQGLKDGLATQVLRGVTGSGKTFTMANIIANVNRPALVICHNKTLAAQLCNEFREFFPENRVEFFVSYYDYYMPESYIPARDLYIEKEIDINDEIDKLRHSATCSLFERRDTIVVASVSCIYGLGAPGEYYKMSLSLRPGDMVSREEVIKKLISIQYTRNDMDFHRGTFRVRGDTLEIYPASYSEHAIRVEFWGDEIERVSEVDALTGNHVANLLHTIIFPASHYVVEGVTMQSAIKQIGQDMLAEVQQFEDINKLVEAQRLKQRVSYDMEMMQEMGYCSGIENYSRYFDGRDPGQPPFTLIDYFPDDFVTFIDESHMTIPQIRGMYNGDRARKNNLVGYGFRLQSAYDNRPLTFDEFDSRIGQLICVSATPAQYEMQRADNIVEQLIRPTGLLDPQIEVRPVEGQIDDLLGEIHNVVTGGGRVLVTTLTKRMAENLTDFLAKHDVRVRYMHSEIDTLERVEIVSGLKKGEFDVLVGINLLREGLDMPQVKLVAILDADKEGFLRSDTALVQTVGRAARNSEGRVIMYADVVTDSMRRAIDETNRRREIQHAYNVQHGIVPKTIVHNVENTLEITQKDAVPLTVKQLEKQIESTTARMKNAANQLDFETAIKLREEVVRLTKQLEKAKRKKNGER